MEEALKDFIQMVGMAIIGLLGAYITHYIKLTTQKLKAQTEKIESDKQKELINNALSRIDLLVQKSVSATEQQLAAGLREAVKDGKIDKSELQALGINVADKVYGQLTDDAKNLLSQELKDVQSYILDCVEDEVRKIKLQ